MLLIPATIANLRTLSDKTWRIQVDTNELPAEQATELLSLHQKFGWFAFSDNPEDKVEIPQEPALEFKTDKSPSQRLRSTLYIFWRDKTNKKKPFDDFYKEWINKKIEEIKDNI